MGTDVRKLIVRTGDSSFNVDVSPDNQVRIEGWAAEVAVAAVDSATYRVTLGEQTVLVYVADAAATRWAFANGQAYAFEVQPQGADRRPAAAVSHETLVAPMPATVSRIVAERGRAVRQGDTVIILEAMKMELAVRAPRNGTVRAVHCREGELVQTGAILAELAA